MNRRQALAASASLTLTAAAPAAAASDTAVLTLLDDFAAAWNRHDVDGRRTCDRAGRHVVADRAPGVGRLEHHGTGGGDHQRALGA